MSDPKADVFVCLNTSSFGEAMLYFSNSEYLFQGKKKHTSSLGKTENTLLQWAITNI